MVAVSVCLVLVMLGMESRQCLHIGLLWSCNESVALGVQGVFPHLARPVVFRDVCASLCFRFCCVSAFVHFWRLYFVSALLSLVIPNYMMGVKFAYATPVCALLVLPSA